MKTIQTAISHFLDIAILKIDNEDNITEIIVNTHSKFNISKGTNIYKIFSKEEKFRLKRVLESALDVRKKYMELNKTLGVNEYVDVKLFESENERYFFIQFFESNREREVMYDRYIEKLTNLSERDPMTKVLNRQGFEEKVKRLISKSDPQKKLGLVYIDIDKLKSINDTYGHEMGDKAILNITNILVSTTRDRDLIARMGGDEFVIVVEEMTGSKSTAYGLANRLLKATAKNQEEKYSTTLSIGVHILEVGKISCCFKDQEKFMTLWAEEIKKVDQAAYTSKIEGRNRISVTKEFSKYYKL